MTSNELKRLSKLENKINKIATDMGFDYLPIEYDIVPNEKMFEILAYGAPTQISNWKFGRNYERQRTIFENVSTHLPYECIIFENPCRAYLMNSNPFAVQALVMAHCVGHSIFFKNNKMFSKSRIDMGGMLAEANHRFIEYEKRYGIDDVERTIDAGHALQMHSSPFDTETENDKKKRLYKSLKKQHEKTNLKFNDLTLNNKNDEEIIINYNRFLERSLNLKTPVEPTEDLLRYIIDNSSSLEDWQKDILEIIRYEGQYYWPIIRTKNMNEGFAVFIHEYIMDILFKDGDLSTDEHGQYNYSNSLVKAQSKMTMNPYLIGNYIWNDLKIRWDKGLHGEEWEQCNIQKIKDNWDTKEMKGLDKIKDVLPTYTDWMFFQDFLTTKMIDELDLYIYLEKKYADGTVDYIRSKHTLDQVRQIIINSFTNSSIPKIEVVDGNFEGAGHLLLNHVYQGSSLDREYCEQTLKHMAYLWGRNIYLRTENKKGELMVKVTKI